jgi:OFA family oxalate/formate antiporter-like MFS transporter
MNTSTHINISITFSRGWLVTIAGAGIGLVIGMLYVWSVIKAGIPDTWGWSNADKALPYSVMALTFSMVMVPAGQLQDRLGPRLVIVLGGFLAGLGCMVCGMGGASLTAFVIGFGLITGTGVGCTYATLTPTAIKWFPPRRTGLIVGIVAAGCGLAPVLLAPLSAWLLNRFAVTTVQGAVEPGVSAAMIVLGISVWGVMGSLLWFITLPPVGFVAPRGKGRTMGDSLELNSRQMVGTTQFWLLYIMSFSGASAGLMFISVAADLGRQALGQWAFIAVVVLSLGNTSGRLIAGAVSDSIGRQWTLFAEFVCQGMVVGLLYWMTCRGGGGWPLVLSIVFMLGLNYGTNPTLLPAACKDYFGIQHFGINYGWLFTSFGLAGLIMPWVNGLITDITGRADLSYLLIIIMMAVSAGLALVSRQIGPPAVKPARSGRQQPERASWR